MIYIYMYVCMYIYTHMALSQIGSPKSNLGQKREVPKIRHLEPAISSVPSAEGVKAWCAAIFSMWISW